MPSFDVVSEVDKHTLTNAVDQASRVVSNRFDFKGVDAAFDRDDFTITVRAEADFQVVQMRDMLKSALHQNGIDIRCLDEDEPHTGGGQVRQNLRVRSGLDSDQCRRIVKLLKESKLKVQPQIQSDQVRVSGKKRDELQAAIQRLKEAPIDMPLQFTNFRD